MKKIAVFILVIAFAARAGAGEFAPPPLPPSLAPPSSPLNFGDFSVNDSIFGQFGMNEPELLSVALAPESTIVAADAPFRLILTLAHKNGGYTYWTNPGGTGVGTRVEWTLPDGFTVSGPEWPTPALYTNSGMNFYIYNGTNSLVYTVTPPPGALRPGEKIILSGIVHTQVCTARTCVPKQLPVTAEAMGSISAKTRNISVAAGGAIAALPIDLTVPDNPKAKGWHFGAADAGGGLVISMHAPAGENRALQNAYFFDSRGEPDQPFVDSQLPQNLERAEEGGAYRLRLPRLPGPARAGENLTGILRVEFGSENADAGNTGTGNTGTGNTKILSFKIDLPIASEGAGLPPALQPAVERQGWVLFAFAFLGGLLLNVMPCVFPVIGLKIMGFAKQAHKERRSVFLHGLAYTAGVLLCFWALALVIITMGRGWGAQLQSEWFLFAMCHIFLVMSMNMAGVFEVGAGVAGAGQQEIAAREGLKRSFLTGLLATLMSTPCSAPFLGTALAYALSLPPVTSLGMFTLMALGFSFPYLALSLFPKWLKKLPKPSAWMDTFRQAMCFPLFGTTAYLFWTMEAMMTEWRFLLLLFGLVLTAMACWLYGKYQHSKVRRPAFARWLAGLAVLVLFGGIWLGLPKGEDELQWQEWSPERVSELRREGVPVYIDFTARWCATCQLNKRVYADETLRTLIRDKNVALLKADWTLYDERITSTLRGEFNKAAVPVTVLYAPGSSRGALLPDLLTVENVSEVLRELP